MQAMQLRCERCHLGTAIALLICHPSQLSLETLAMMAKSTSLYFASNRHLAATLGVCNTLGVLAGRRIRSRRSRAGRSCRASSLDTAHTQPLECSEWLPSVSMDPNGLDISEESNIKVPSRLQLAFLLHLQQYGVLCRLYAFPYCTPAAPPHTAYGPAPASSQHAVATSGNPDAPPASVKSRRHATCLWPRLYDSARSRRSSPALAITTASRAVRSLTSAT